jgi:hypothetical protein
MKTGALASREHSSINALDTAYVGQPILAAAAFQAASSLTLGTPPTAPASSTPLPFAACPIRTPELIRGVVFDRAAGFQPA